MLRFPDEWYYTPPASIPEDTELEIFELINRTARNDKSVYELYKKYFASASGNSYSSSSSTGWAQSDLQSLLSQAAANGALFIGAYWDASEELRTHSTHPVPPEQIVNTLLSRTKAQYQIKDGSLLFTGVIHTTAAPTIPLSMEQEARNRIEKSLNEGDEFLKQGKYKAAVQEILWLLETVSTAFKGLKNEKGEIKEDYFNVIIKRLKRDNAGKAFEQISSWIATLHGWLSSPGGGGIRHGTNVKDSKEMTPSEAHLYYNLVRSYIGYLLAEYDRLAGSTNNKANPF